MNVKIDKRYVESNDSRFMWWFQSSAISGRAKLADESMKLVPTVFSGLVGVEIAYRKQGSCICDCVLWILALTSADSRT